jgi:hypothetical protein
MTKAETAKLDKIISQIETLQRQTGDEKAKERLNAAKEELMRIQYL